MFDNINIRYYNTWYNISVLKWYDYGIILYNKMFIQYNFSTLIILFMNTVIKTYHRIKY